MNSRRDVPVASIASNPSNENTMLISYDDGTLVLWDMNRQAIALTYDNQKSQPIQSMCWHASGDQFVTGHEDGSLGLWEIYSTNPLRRFCSTPYFFSFADCPVHSNARQGKAQSCSSGRVVIGRWTVRIRRPLCAHCHRRYDGVRAQRRCGPPRGQVQHAHAHCPGRRLRLFHRHQPGWLS